MQGNPAVNWVFLIKLLWSGRLNYHLTFLILISPTGSTFDKSIELRRKKMVQGPNIFLKEFINSISKIAEGEKCKISHFVYGLLINSLSVLRHTAFAAEKVMA